MLKVKASFKARGSRGHWFSSSGAGKIQRRVRSQCLPNLMPAGQWPKDPPWHGEERPHLMRAMLVANAHVPERFANGATGRLPHWEPVGGHSRKPDKAKDDRVCARFCHESAMSQRVRMPGVDFLDVIPTKSSRRTRRP